MKRLIAILVMVALVLGMTMPAMAAPPTMPPKGEHFTFNCVTESGSFSDTFDGDLSQWTNISGSGAIVDDGGNNVYERTGGSYVGAVVSVAGSQSWDDYVFEFDVKKVSGNYFNVVFRYVDQGNHYLLEPSADEVHIALFKKVGGGYTELTATRPLQNTTPGTWYHYIIEVAGNSIKIYVDGTLKFDVTDTSFSAGKIGVGAYDDGSVAHFDDVLVMGPNVKVMGANEILVPLIGSGRLGFTEGSPFQILDNDMTDGQAWVQVPAGIYDTYDQARGKPGGDMLWGDSHIRATGKPEWNQHNNDLNWWTGRTGNWAFINDYDNDGKGVTCYSFRLYPLP